MDIKVKDKVNQRHVGRNLQRIRVYLGMKQEALASDLGVSCLLYTSRIPYILHSSKVRIHCILVRSGQHLFAQLGNFIPVSYTHLDVYKRQV